MRHPRSLSLLAFSTVSLLALVSFAVPAGSAAKIPKQHQMPSIAAAKLDGLSATREEGTFPPVAENFDVIGHSGLGHDDTNGDVWVHAGFAYVGTWSNPCTGAGAKIVDVSDPANPTMIGRIGARNGTSAEDVVVRNVATPTFTGALLAVGLQRCGEGDALNHQLFGAQFWDVTDPTSPMKLGSIGITHGGGGVHELDLVQTGGNVYALLAAPFAEWFDSPPGGDFFLVDVTDPANPAVLSEWGAGAHGLSRGPFDGIGQFGASFDHSARASSDGTQVYLSYWDLGVLTLDISDPTDPQLVEQTNYPADADGEGHSVVPYDSANGPLLLQNDEDFQARSPVHIVFGDGPEYGVGSESVFTPPLWKFAGHDVEGAVLRPDRQGCSADDYPAARRVRGKIVVVKTYVSTFGSGHSPACRQRKQDGVAAELGAKAVLHDWISPDTSAQWWDSSAVDIPVTFAEHSVAVDALAAGRMTIEALEPSWGFLRVFDAATGDQLATFDDVPHMHSLHTLGGAWSIHNTEVNGDRAYSSWYTNGVVALDLSPLDAVTPTDPVQVGQFVPEARNAVTDALPDTPLVWGVDVRKSDGLVFVSDMNGGLWIVQPTGSAVPT
jgi:hypothetical protein